MPSSWSCVTLASLRLAPTVVHRIPGSRGSQWMLGLENVALTHVPSRREPEGSFLRDGVPWAGACSAAHRAQRLDCVRPSDLGPPIRTVAAAATALCANV